MLDQLLPMRCLLCSLDCGRAGLCDPCRQDLPWNDAPCRLCGIPLQGDSDGVCGPCLARPPVFERTVSPLLYEFPVRELIQQFKFRRNLAAGRALAGLFSGHLLKARVEIPDRLVPVPLHGFRLFNRGFNQAFDLARQIGRELDIPLLEYSLRRTRRTRAQAGLDAGERRKNLRGAFTWHGRPLSGMHVALVDDVMTTGTTVKECAGILRKAGVMRVDIWVIARAAKTS